MEEGEEANQSEKEGTRGGGGKGKREPREKEEDRKRGTRRRTTCNRLSTGTYLSVFTDRG